MMMRQWIGIPLRFRLLAAVIAMAFFCPAGLDAAGKDGIIAKKTGDSVVDPEVLTIDGGFGRAINGKSFQQDALATHRGFQYVAYYDAKRRVCLARRELPAGAWSVIRFDDYDFKSNDAHNTISIGICPGDGTIHMAFDHHGHALHYRVSQKGAAADPGSDAGAAWDAALFGPVTSELEKGKPIRITYPRFWQTPDGGLQFCYRQGGSGNGDRMLVDYNPDTGTWSGTRMIDSRKGTFEDSKGESTSRCSYPNGYDYGPGGKLHATWVWREGSQGANHDLCYACSENRGRTWLNSSGEPLDGPPRVDSPGIAVVPISRAHGLMNTHGQAVDSKGRIHAVMWHCSDESLAATGSRPGEHRWGPPEARRYHHYWRDASGAWHHVELPGRSGSRPKLFMDRDDNAYLIYAPFVNEMIGDVCRWRQEQVLSIMVQEMPAKPHDQTPLRIVDLVFRKMNPDKNR